MEIQQLNYNDWKQLGLLPQEICKVIIPVFSNPNSGPPFAWPGTDWDWISQSRWLAPNGTYWICGSYLWARLPPGWIGRWTLGLAFTHGFIFSELPEKPANLPHLKTQWARSAFHWCDYLAAVFVPSLGTTDVLLWADALTNFTQQVLQDSQKAISALQFSSVAQSCLTLCDPMNRSPPGLPVDHHLLQFTQPHVHGVGDALQPSHPLSSPFPPAPNPSQHQSLFQWVNSSYEVAKVLEFQL